jgi:hypothetical protein
MKKYFLILLLPVFYLNATNFHGSFMTGYNGGLSFEAAGRLSQFASDFPLQMRFSIAYTYVKNPGHALDARHIFINDNSNGDPEKSGHYWDFGFDFLYKISLLKMKSAYVYFGPHYSAFTGNFNFVGGNEDFDITSGQWGLAAGLMSFFPINTDWSFAVSGGLTYYFPSELSGHDTTYSPDGEHINARDPYGYGDANDAINQPNLEFRIMIGLSYLLK